MVEGGDNKRIEDEDDLLFRFRSTAALLGTDPKKGGFQELEKEEIYFARPEELNDPMEGLTDVFWQGDDVLWENQIRHYVLTFVWYFGLWFVDNTEPFKPLRMQGGMSREDLPSDTYRTIVDAACSTVFAIPEVQWLPSRLSKVSFAVRRHGMRTMLMLLHPFVLDAVFQQLFEHRLYPQELPSMAEPSQVDSLLQALDRLPSDHGATLDVAEDFAETVGKIGSDMNEQMLLITLANAGERGAKWADLMASFPARYIEAAVRDLHYNPWRTACFSRNCSNASMWGVYADGHRGVALVFRPTTKDGRRTLRLRGMLGTGPNGNPSPSNTVSALLQLIFFCPWADCPWGNSRATGSRAPMGSRVHVGLRWLMTRRPGGTGRWLRVLTGGAGSMSTGSTKRRSDSLLLPLSQTTQRRRH